MAIRGRAPARDGSPVRTPKQRAGDAAEAAAASHLLAQGCTLLARNARYREGELDLVVLERGVVVFVEVRMRSGMAFGGAVSSVDRFKQKRLMRAAQHWLLQQYGERWPACRFDVVCVGGNGTIEWIRDAFAA
jgi:putative endonuclease